MIDAVDRLLVERSALDRGFPNGFLVSAIAHGALVLVAVIGPMIFPSRPVIHVMDGLIVPLPPGGGGPRSPEPPAPAPPSPQVQPPPVPDQPKPKIIKPPKEEPPKKAIPELNSKPARKPAKSTPTPARQAPASGAAGGTGKNTQTPGIDFGPVGPGVPGGTDPLGDWYMAAVQRKIWMLWTQQVHAQTPQPVTVRFTIVADGSVEDVQIMQSSGAYLLDAAAQRAVQTAGPFSPLPKNYETNRVTIQAIFKPTS